MSNHTECLSNPMGCCMVMCGWASQLLPACVVEALVPVGCSYMLNSPRPNKQDTKQRRKQEPVSYYMSLLLHTMVCSMPPAHLLVYRPQQTWAETWQHEFVSLLGICRSLPSSMHYVKAHQTPVVPLHDYVPAVQASMTCCM